jgi:hypothetical protein
LRPNQSRVEQLSLEHDDKNWEYRSWLKQNAPDNIDGIVKAVSQKYFAAYCRLLPARQIAKFVVGK